MRRMLKISTAMLAFVALAFTCFGAAESRVLQIPLGPCEQKVSEKMRQQISTLEAEGVLTALQSWKTIRELPAWVFVNKKREIAYIFGRPLVSDDYRYAVILSRGEKVIVVRAGGIAGSYDIFVKPRT